MQIPFPNDKWWLFWEEAKFRNTPDKQTGPEKLTIKAEDIKGTYVSNMTKGIGLLTKIATSIELLWYFRSNSN